jgi:hypothetical protein
MGNRPIHQNANHVQRGIHRVAQRWRHAQATLPQRGKQILDGVRNLLDTRQTGCAGAAFQAMRSAKKLVDQRAIIGMIGMLLHFEQQRRDCSAMLRLLFTKGGKDLRHDVIVVLHTAAPAC